MRRILACFLALLLLCPASASGEAAEATSAGASNSLEALLQKGVQYVKDGDYESAAICYDISLKLSPDAPVVYALMADMHFAQEDYESALTCAERALALSPADGTLYLLKALILFRAERFDEAELALRYADICGAQPSDALYVEAALSYAGNGYYIKCVEMFDKADSALWWTEHAELYGRALIRSGNSERAEELGLSSQGAKDPALAEAILQGKTIILAPVREDIMGYPVFVSAAAAEELREQAEEEGIALTPTSDGLRCKVASNLAEIDFDGDAALVSTSPSGDVSLYSLEGELAVVQRGEITLLYPNYARGEHDEEYATYTLRYWESFATMLEQDSITWSPDERYFAITFPTKSIIMARFFDLILADTWTGEVFLAEATPKKMNVEGTQTAISAVFDENSKYVYYLVYGKISENSRCGIKRYNLATGTAELLSDTGEIFVDRPRIWLDGDGSIRAVTDTNRRDESTGIITFALTNSKWKYSTQPFTNTLRYQRPIRYLYSANSRAELLLNQVATVYYMTLTADTHELPADNIATMLPIEGHVAEQVIVDDAFVAAHITEIRNGEGKALAYSTMESPWMNLINAELSPDGYYVLILASHIARDNRGPAVGLYLLDIDTQQFTRLALPEDVTLANTATLGSTTNLWLSWMGNDRIVVPTEEGNMVCSIEIK